MRRFFVHWCIDDIGKAYTYYDKYDQDLNKGHIKFVTYQDVGIELGRSGHYVTKELCDQRTHIMITELGENTLYMEAL